MNISESRTVQRRSADVTSARTAARYIATRRRLLGSVAALSGVGVLNSCATSRKRLAQPLREQGKPRYGGHLDVPTATDPSNFDPSIKSGGIANVMSLTNSRLVGLKTGSTVKYEELTLVPKLAERWETPDGQTYTFHLRQGVRFANLTPVNGRELTAADVKWSYEYLTRTGAVQGRRLPPSTVATLFEGLEQIDTPDPGTVVMRLSKPFAPFLTYVSSEFASVVAHEIFDEDGSFAKRAVGTGPWQLDNGATQHGSRWVFKRNPTYFESGLPYVDEIDWLVLPDAATTKAAFQSRQIDCWSGQDITHDVVDQTQRAVNDLMAYKYLDPSPNHIYLNQARPALRDERIRQAIARSIDRDEFIRVFSAGEGEWAIAGALPGAFSREETRQLLQFDPAAARQLLSAAGFPDGVQIQFLYPSDFGQARIAMVQLLQAQLKKGGINLSLESVDYATYSSRKHAGNFEMGSDPRTGVGYADPDGTLYPVFHPNSDGNYAKINDPELTSLLDAERQEIDPNKRNEIVRQAVRRIADRSWALALFYGTSYELWHNYFKNYAPNRAAWGFLYTNTWLEK